MSQALAVTRYTLLELTRRRLLLVILAIGVFFSAAAGIAPHVLPGFRSDQDRVIFMLNTLGIQVPLAITLCAFAFGMTVINHDLDSGTVVAIFAKPVSRFSYAGGKLLAALSLLLLIGAVFTAGSLIIVAANGGGPYEVVFWTYAALAANAVLLMLLVMTLTVYVNNIVAAAIVFVFNFVAGNVLTLHAMVEHHVITDAVAKAAVSVAYWGVPHELTSNLQRQIFQMQMDIGQVRFAGQNPLDRIPGASGSADILFWFAYLIVICAVLFWSVRRKQV